MIFGLFRKKNNNQAIVDRQYSTLTAAARMPEFYESMNVPDTVMGRFEMLSVVMILFFRRTRSSGTSGQEIAQEIVDAFFQDIDHSIRELGHRRQRRAEADEEARRHVLWPARVLLGSDGCRRSCGSCCGSQPQYSPWSNSITRRI